MTQGGKGAPVLCAVLVALGVLLSSVRASAYPQFVFKGYGGCADCHHSPTGGGLPNGWGRSSLDTSWSWGKSDGGDPDLTYDPAAELTPKLDLGLDARFLPLFTADGDASLGTLIPMLTELGGAAALGRFELYATVAPRKLAGSGLPVAPFSREHWLGVDLGSGIGVRAGRLVLPFGLRQPDHTQYVREDFGFDKYDQSYALELDTRMQSWSLFGAAFVGDLVRWPAERQERGAALTGLREWGGGGALGLSLLGSTSTARTRVAGSLFARLPLAAGTYALAEAAAQRFRARAGDDEQLTLAEFVRLGWFARPALDLYLELGHRTFPGTPALTKMRAGVGASWQLFQWFELIPQLLVEARSDLPLRTVAMGQLHFVY